MTGATAGAYTGGMVKPKPTADERDAAVSALLDGRNTADAADAAGMDRPTLHDWMRDDADFIAALNGGRRRLRDAADTRLLALAGKAMDCLERAVEDGDARAALAVLKGLGLPGPSIRCVGPDDPATVRQALAMRDLTGA